MQFNQQRRGIEVVKWRWKIRKSTLKPLLEKVDSGSNYHIQHSNVRQEDTNGEREI